MNDGSPPMSPQNLGIKPNNMRVSKNTTSKKISVDNPQFLHNEAFDIPDDVQENTFKTHQKSLTVPDGELFYSNSKNQFPQQIQYKGNRYRQTRSKFGATKEKFNVNDPMKLSYNKPWNISDQEKKYDENVSMEEQPISLLDPEDYQRRFKLQKLKQIRLESMCEWKKKDLKGQRKNAYIKQIQRRNNQILKIAEKSDLEKLEVYTDRFPLLQLRKGTLKMGLLIKLVCNRIINTNLFDNISISVILLNSIVMALDDSASSDTPNPIFEIFEMWFQWLYSVEMIFKILGLGFIFGPDSYLRDSWNILDFVIVMIGWITIWTTEDVVEVVDQPGPQEEKVGISVSSLRTFRVLRPLKTISSIKGLKVLIVAVLSALPMLKDTIMILIFFFIIFSIACTQMFNGKLKNRCFNIQTGQVHPDNNFCNDEDPVVCTGGYYCARGKENPNYGVTNFDNLGYSFLTIFQFVTLEGWSEVQRDIQITYTKHIWILFMVIVLSGAFFLLNLTLAVINSKFTESQNKQQEQDRIELKESALPDGANNNDNQEIGNGQDEMSISQYISARIYAKKMIEFLRLRQTIKQVELERTLKAKQRQQMENMAKRSIRGQPPVQIKKMSNFQIVRKSMDQAIKTSESSASVNVLMLGQNLSSKSMSNMNLLGQNTDDINNNIIQEDIHGEQHNEENSDLENEKLDRDIQDFLKKTKIDMQRQGVITKDFRIPRTIDTSAKKDIRNVTAPNFFHQSQEGGPTMKGNIEPVKKGFWNPSITNGFNKKLAEEFDIDNVIPKDDQREKVSENHEADSMASFQLDLNQLDGNSSQQDSQKNMNMTNSKFYGHHGASQTLDLGNEGQQSMILIPGIDIEEMNKQNDSGLITSDSDFEIAEAAAIKHPDGYDHEFQIVAPPKTALDVRKDVTKAFKKMLTINNQRTSTDHRKDTDNSTKYAGSQVNFDHSNQDLSFNDDLESKFIKKKTKYPQIKKNFQEDIFQEDFLENMFSNKKEKEDSMLKSSVQMHDIRKLEEFVNTKTPLDPFKNLNPLTHKVEIAKDQNYAGTSQLDVFMARKVEQDLNIIANSNQYVKRPDGPNSEFNELPYIKNVWNPYQQKCFFQVEIESSEEDESLNEDELQAQEQPFYTPMRIGYLPQTKQIHTQETAKRADIMITSTLSLSLFPKDKRKIKDHVRVEMNQDDVDEYIDEKNAFRSMVKEHSYQVAKTREKDKEYRENYKKSFFARAAFQSKTLIKFKRQVKLLNTNKKQQSKKHKDQIKFENQKHQQNIRASEKRGLPQFDMEMSRKLLDGKFHEEDEEEAEETQHLQVNNKTINFKSFQEIQHQAQVEKFEMQLQMILDQDDEEDSNFREDEIPFGVRKQFNIPRNLGTNMIDYNQIRSHDGTLKKRLPIWSGQDVLRDSFDNQKSLWVVQHLNKHRVWPVGIFGIYKRTKFVLRCIVKAEAYDHFFTFWVFLNTITLSLNAYGLSKELGDFLESTNIYFTWIFIVEMFAKIGGIGIKKYCADTMNYMDGFIVMASIVELVYGAVAADEGGLSALNLLRLLRTLRVVRIIRLLRSLESIQTIVSVMARSYMSFVYITGLMWLFILIFTLLGIQSYGGYWKEDPEGLPANHFDSFGYAIFTVFQVLTMENWQSVLFVMNRQNKNQLSPYGASGFLIAWIVMGNFILLNLFLAILLDAFLVDGEELSDEELHMIKMKKLKRKLEKKRKKEALMVKMDTTEIKKMNQLPELSKFYFGMEKQPEEEDLEDLDEDQVVQIFKDQGLIKKDQAEIKEQKLFVGIECKQSFYIFSQENSLRIACYKLIKWGQWENVVIFLISASSFKLVYDTYFIDAQKDDIRAQISSGADQAFNYLFIFEMVTKLIALGLIMDEGSYLRDNWNRMDFFIVCSSIVDMLLEGRDLAALKILRMLRTLRPLRFLTHNVGLKLIVNALIGSISGITNVMLVVAVVYLIFAILFINFYAGKFFYCSIDPYILHSEPECLFAGGSWELYDHNFDNAKSGWITLFIVASLEGWPDIFIQAVESVGIDEGPALGQNTTTALVLFILFIFVGSFFFLNFFIGVLFMKFNKAQEEEQKGYTDKDLAWMDIQRLILSAVPDYESTNVPKSEFRKKFHDLVSLPKFDAFIMSIIILNMIQMAMLTDQMTVNMMSLMSFTNYIFTVIFIIEAILKIIAFGGSYLHNNWNRFDFFVVLASIFDIVLVVFDFDGGAALSVLPKIARVMRVLRVTRILRLAGKAKSLQAILQTITFSIPALANVFILLMLIYFMLAVLVNFQFNNITEGEVIDPDYKNFKNFINSFVLLFALSTGEDWNKVMFDCSREKKDGCIEGQNCGNTAFSYAFFIILILVCSYVMLNLFILVIIQQFEKYYLPEVNMLGLFKSDLVSFMKIWKELTQNRYDCLKIKENQISSFFRKLGTENETLGFSYESFDEGDLKKNILKMAIKSDNGYIFFNEMLYRCMRRKYGNMKINKKMQIFELKTQYSIYLMTLKIQDKRKKNMTNQDIFNSIIKKENGVNPFLTVMNFKISFKTWLKAAREEIDQGNQSNKVTHGNGCSHKNQRVEIEVDEFHQYTSEEETIDELGISSYNDRTGGTKSSGTRSQEGSYRAEREKDDLALFEKRMSKKLVIHKNCKHAHSNTQQLESKQKKAAKSQKVGDNTNRSEQQNFKSTKVNAVTKVNQKQLNKVTLKQKLKDN